MRALYEFLLRNKAKIGGTMTAIIMVLPISADLHWVKEVLLILSAALGGSGLGDKDSLAAAKQAWANGEKIERRSPP